MQFHSLQRNDQSIHTIPLLTCTADVRFIKPTRCRGPVVLHQLVLPGSSAVIMQWDGRWGKELQSTEQILPPSISLTYSWGEWSSNYIALQSYLQDIFKTNQVFQMITFNLHITLSLKVIWLQWVMFTCKHDKWRHGSFVSTVILYWRNKWGFSSVYLVYVLLKV